MSPKTNIFLGLALIILIVQIKFQRDYLDGGGSGSEGSTPLPARIPASSESTPMFSESNPNNKVYISKSSLATPECVAIADRSGMDYNHLFYLNFAPTDASIMREWVKASCPELFFTVFVTDEDNVQADSPVIDSVDGGGGRGEGAGSEGGENNNHDQPPLAEEPAPPTTLLPGPTKATLDPHSADAYEISSLPQNHVKSEVVDFNSKSEHASAVVFRPHLSLNPDNNAGKFWSDEKIDIHHLHDSKRNNVDDEADLPNTLVKIADLQADESVHVTTDGNCPEGQKETHECCKRADPMGVWQQKRNPLVAICSGVTSRGIPREHQHVNKLALFVHLLPSIARTYDCDVDYLIVIAFDKGDEFYDSDAGQEELKNWLLQNLAKPMGERGVNVNFMLVEVENDKKKPGPVFNAMLREAYHAGADFFYRLNDDTELTSVNTVNREDKWTKAFIKELRSMGPPFGVIGPDFAKGNTKILTHDFVHRTHMDIFSAVYYDPYFTDWWMDDYISYLYGRDRTVKAKKFTVNHHSGHHGGKRYEVHEDKTAHLPGSIKEGREKIANWMRRYVDDVNEDVITALVSSPQGQPYRDLSAA